MTPRDANADLLAEMTALRDRVASLTREKTQADAQATEALEQKTATAEILRVISSSTTDVQPVFDAIASRVVRLSDAFFSTVWRYDGTLIHHGVDGRAPTRTVRGRTPGKPERRGDSDPGLLTKTRRTRSVKRARDDTDYHDLASRAR